MISVFGSGLAQEASKKERREKSRIEKQHQVESLIFSKEFIFIATRALPQGGNSVDLTTNTNFVKFYPEEIESYMPFFGRAYSAEYGGDGGIKFKGKPDEYNIVDRKGGRGFEIIARIPATHDNYILTLNVGIEGSASLTINSNQKSSISYIGSIMKLEEPEEK